MKKIVHMKRLKNFTLFAVDKVTKDYNFVLSVDATNLKSAREFAKPKILQLNRTFPSHHFDFKWEQDNV